MLSKKEINKIREHLENSQNPIFFYDNDCDGLCGFLLLKRWLGKGCGVAIRSYPELKKDYARKVSELKGDCVFVLDKPVIEEGFLDEVGKRGVGVVIIDHHPDSLGIAKGRENVFLYNSYGAGKEEGEPVSYLCYELAGRKEDMWIAMMGCIADHYLPDFADEFGERHREFWSKGIKKPFDALYRTEIGKIARALNFGLKDSASNVVKLQNFLIGTKGAEEVLAEDKENKSFLKKYSVLRKKYEELIEKAKNYAVGDVLFFLYGGETSMSADIANELCYTYPEKYIIVGYKRGDIVNLSLRGKNVCRILKDIINEMPSVIGGGHKNAAGGRINVGELERFKELFKRIGKD